MPNLTSYDNSRHLGESPESQANYLEELGLKNSVLSEPNEPDVFNTLRTIRNRNINVIVLVHWNINSIHNKFEMLKEIVSGKMDILLKSETKIENTFPTDQFHIPGFSNPYRLDKTSNGGGLLLYKREDIPSKMLQTHNKGKQEFFLLKLTYTKING